MLLVPGSNHDKAESCCNAIGHLTWAWSLAAFCSYLEWKIAIKKKKTRKPPGVWWYILEKVIILARIADRPQVEHRVRYPKYSCLPCGPLFMGCMQPIDATVPQELSLRPMGSAAIAFWFHPWHLVGEVRFLGQRRAGPSPMGPCSGQALIQFCSKLGTQEQPWSSDKHSHEYLRTDMR